MLFPKGRRLWWILSLLLFGLMAISVGCHCGRRQQPAPAPGAVSPPNLKGQLQNMNPAAKQACVDACKTFCQKTQQCKVPKMDKPAVCGKACIMLCAYNVMDEEMRGCVKSDSTCPQVTECATKLGDKLKAARDAKLKGAYGGAGTGAPGAQPEAPTAPATTGQPAEK